MSAAEALGFVGDCLSGKRRFDTEAAAHARMGRGDMRGLDPNRPKSPVRAYHCHLCTGWHLTSRPSKRRRRT
jgi:hypothetical protein